MPLDLSEGKKLIQTVLGYSLSVRAGMNYLLEYCFKLDNETPAWKKISALDFEKDAAQLLQWINQTLTDQPPEDNIKAYWFGLYFPELNDGETTCELYLSGSIHFAANDNTARWAALDESTYLPEGCYAKSPIPNKMYYTIHQYNVAEIGDTMLLLGYACLVLKASLSRVDQKVIAQYLRTTPYRNRL